MQFQAKEVSGHHQIEPTAAIDIRVDYVAKNGAPSAAAPKIFFPLLRQLLHRREVGRDAGGDHLDR